MAISVALDLFPFSCLIVCRCVYASSLWLHGFWIIIIIVRFFLRSHIKKRNYVYTTFLIGHCDFTHQRLIVDWLIHSFWTRNDKNQRTDQVVVHIIPSSNDSGASPVSCQLSVSPVMSRMNQLLINSTHSSYGSPSLQKRPSYCTY